MNKFERFCNRHGSWGIRNLMLYIVIGNILVFLLAQTDRGAQIVYNLYFIPELIKQGQVWRLLTFVFVPASGSIFTFALSMYFYYMIGSSLEREWGTLKFNVFYFSGMLFTMIYSFLAGAIADATYLNLSMFFAFATLYPDMQLLLFFVIPIKIKYLGYINALLFLLGIVFNRFPYNILPLIALANYLLFFGGYFIGYFKRRRFETQNTIEFKSKIRDLKKERGYLHKCTICGKTDTDYPDMEFRYCSQCKGYACYCEEHILNHKHIE